MLVHVGVGKLGHALQFPERRSPCLGRRGVLVNPEKNGEDTCPCRGNVKRCGGLGLLSNRNQPVVFGVDFLHRLTVFQIPVLAVPISAIRANRPRRGSAGEGDDQRFA